MYQPLGFSDSENIVIVNKTPYFYYIGTTYKEKLKNGLSLEYVFEQEDVTFTKCIRNEKVVQNIPKTNPIYYEDEYDENKYQIRHKRKNKKVRSKKSPAKKYKKTSIKKDGYKYKLFVIDQHLPEIIPLCDDDVSAQTDYDYQFNDNDNYDPDYLDFWSYT